jgi:hypothetical protein
LAGTSAALKIRLFLLTLYAILVMPCSRAWAGPPDAGGG